MKPGHGCSLFHTLYVHCWLLQQARCAGPIRPGVPLLKSDQLSTVKSKPS